MVRIVHLPKSDRLSEPLYQIKQPSITLQPTMRILHKCTHVRKSENSLQETSLTLKSPKLAKRETPTPILDPFPFKAIPLKPIKSNSTVETTLICLQSAPPRPHRLFESRCHLGGEEPSNTRRIKCDGNVIALVVDDPFGLVWIMVWMTILPP